MEHCINGHPWNKANTHDRGAGKRACRACANAARLISRKDEQDARNQHRIETGMDRQTILSTCLQMDALLPGEGNLVTRLRKVMIENRTRRMK